MLALATSALLGGVYALARSPWAVAALAAVCLPVARCTRVVRGSGALVVAWPVATALPLT